MKHRVSFRSLGRSRAHRRAMLRTQVTQLVEHESMETTVAKAKELRRVADRVITIGKLNTLTSMRKLFGYLRTKDAVRKVFNDLAPRFEERNGGYTRVLKTRFRRGDRAPLAVIEWSQTSRSILTEDQLQRKELRKSKHRRQQRQGLAQVLDLAAPS